MVGWMSLPITLVTIGGRMSLTITLLTIGGWISSTITLVTIAAKILEACTTENDDILLIANISAKDALYICRSIGF